MTISNFAFIDWNNRYWSLADYQGDLHDRLCELDRAIIETSANGVSIGTRIRELDVVESEYNANRFPLSIKLDLRQGFYPRYNEADYQTLGDTMFWWKVGDGAELGYTDHPLFTLLERLASYTGHEVKCSASHRPAPWEEVKNQQHHHVVVTFYSTEDIRKPSSYLKALAARMAEWVKKSTEKSLHS